MKRGFLLTGLLSVFSLISTTQLLAATEITSSDNAIELSQNSDYTFTGADGYYVNPSFFTQNSDGSYKFQAVSGTYQVKTDATLKYIQVQAFKDGAAASLQSDGTGALWIIGSGLGLPTVASNDVGWSTGKAICMAQTSKSVYSITLVVGQQVSGVNFKFFHQNNWGNEYDGTSDKPYVITSNSTILGVGDGTGGHDNGNLYIKDGITPNMNDTVIITVDCTKPAAAVLTTVYKPAQTVFAPAFNGTPLTADNGYYIYKGTLENGVNYATSGADAMTATDWYYNPDFFSRNSDGTYKFIAATGKYEIKADFTKKAFNVFAIDANDAALTLQSDGTGQPWAIGFVGKPKNHNDDNQSWWTDVDHAVALAKIGTNVYRLTCTVGQEIKSDYVALKFYGQPGWSPIEFNNSTYKITMNTNDLFVLKESGDINKADAATLTDGDTYVFTLDLTSMPNATLTVTGKGISTGINDVNAASVKKDIYTLQGVKVATPTQKGIYIIDGKKMIVK